MEFYKIVEQSLLTTKLALDEFACFYSFAVKCVYCNEMRKKMVGCISIYVCTYSRKHSLGRLVLVKRIVSETSS